MHSQWRGTLGLVLSAAAALTFGRIPVASSQGLTVIAAQVQDDLPERDPASPQWSAATAVEVPLSAQAATRPITRETRVRSVTVRALHNGTRIAFRLDWADSTEDQSMARTEDFRDAVAIQFPLAEGPPFFCMGQAGGTVNIWHWKADWQADIDRAAAGLTRTDVDTTYPAMHVDLYPFADPAAGPSAGPATYLDVNYLPALAAGNLLASGDLASPVEDLVAGGFGSLTSQPAEGQNVQGYGTWTRGGWQVVFSRDLGSPEVEDIRFAPGRVYSIAFAAWEGANGERDGQKSTSQWVSLQLAGAPPRAAPAAQEAVVSSMEGFWFVIAPMLTMAGLITAGFGAASLMALLRERN